MTVYVFTGPTLPPAEARSIWQANYLPPAAHGDVYRAALRQPRAIGIIDGYFEGVPSVWHKEILWALSQGIHVFGSASMGALRAAELDRFGMVGVGAIYQAYRDGTLEDDDEVAVVHGPPELGYRAATEAMVNIRATLAKAKDAGVVGDETAEALVRSGKGLFYKDRDWRYHWTHAAAAARGLASDELERLHDWLADGRVNQKRLDAEAMLGEMQRLIADGTEPKRVDYSFEHTENWQDATARYAAGLGDEGESVLHDHVLEELRLSGADYHAAVRGGLLRLLAAVEGDRQRMEVTTEQVKSAAKNFRLAFGLLSRKDIDDWLAQNHLGPLEFDRLMKEDARLKALQARTAPALNRYIIDHLRASGEYAELAARARDKKEALDALEMNEVEPDGLSAMRLTVWYFEQRLGQDLPDDVHRYAADIGFADPAAFQRAVLREYQFVLAAEQKDSQD
jgi:AraC-like DNA-binding protein